MIWSIILLRSLVFSCFTWSDQTIILNSWKLVDRTRYLMFGLVWQSNCNDNLLIYIICRNIPLHIRIGKQEPDSMQIFWGKNFTMKFKNFFSSLEFRADQFHFPRVTPPTLPIPRLHTIFSTNRLQTTESKSRVFNRILQWTTCDFMGHIYVTFIVWNQDF